jgi:hypothetical protein
VVPQKADIINVPAWRKHTMRHTASLCFNATGVLRRISSGA